MRASNDGWRALFSGQTVSALNQDTGELVYIPPYVRNPASAEGMIIRFLYSRGSDGTSERIVLCWRCWTSAGTIYVSGLCAHEKALRPFIVANMSEVIDLHNDLPIRDAIRYFLPLAQIDPSDVQNKRLFEIERSEMKKTCLLGRRVLSYIAYKNQLSPDYEREVIGHYLDHQLRLAGTTGSRLKMDLLKSLEKQKLNFDSARAAAKTLASDEYHLELVWSYAEQFAQALQMDESGGGGGGIQMPPNKLERILELIGNQE